MTPLRPGASNNLPFSMTSMNPIRLCIRKSKRKNMIEMRKQKRVYHFMERP
jgi:hypothetical protein